MPRVSRLKSRSGIYHIIMRGINRQVVFEDEEDHLKFIQTLKKYRSICQYSLFAYCLMGNHVHLLIKEGEEPLATVMRRICGSYVLWYNKKYERVGHLFQDRYKSESIEDESYFLTVLRYIYQNPIKGGMANKIENYLWTNYSHYIEGASWTDIDFALNIFNTDRSKAVTEFINYVNKESNDVCLELEDNIKLNDNEAIKIIRSTCNVERGNDLQTLEINLRNRYIKELKVKHGLSIRQIERLTGINRGLVQRI